MPSLPDLPFLNNLSRLPFSVTPSAPTISHLTFPQTFLAYPFLPYTLLFFLMQFAAHEITIDFVAFEKRFLDTIA
jgi:hypothetical protein